jgi:D-alanine-D-alanine ligase
MMAKDDLIVKPVSAGSSVATALVSKSKDLHKAIETALAADPEGRCLVEPRIVGRELTVAVLGNRVLEALPVIEIRPKAAFFDIESKYDSKMCDELCPAPIPKNVAKAAQDLAKRAHVVLGCRGYSRSDIIWDVRKDKLYVLETNTLPGMTATSLMPKASQAAGLAFIGLLERMIELAQEPRHI